MSVKVGMFVLVVDDYDRGIGFYRDAIGLELIEDTDMGGGKRWVVLEGDGGARVLIAKAADATQAEAIGRQTGGRVGFFLTTDNFEADHAAFVRAGVKFLESPRHESYGSVAVFEDPFGNKWDLIQPR